MKTWMKVLGAGVLLVAVLAIIARPPAAATGVSAANSEAAPSAPLAPSSRRILIIGGTKGIGLETARRALARGHQVTVMARRATDQLPTSNRLTVLRGDILDPAAVLRAVDGQDAVITTISAPMSREPTSVFSDGIRNVLVAMKTRPDAQLLAVTGIGAGDSAGHGGAAYDRVFVPLMLRRIYDDKDREEALIRASAVNWMIIRPGFLNDDAESTGYRVVTSLAGVRSGSISRASVAHFLVTTVETGAAPRRTILLTH